TFPQSNSLKPTIFQSPPSEVEATIKTGIPALLQASTAVVFPAASTPTKNNTSIPFAINVSTFEVCIVISLSESVHSTLTLCPTASANASDSTTSLNVLADKLQFSSESARLLYPTLYK